MRNTTKMGKLKYLCLWLLLSPVILYGQTAKIEQLITATQKADKVPAIAIGIFHRDSVLLQKGYGYLSANHKTPTTVDSHFHFGSITKTFVAIAILQLVEKGGLQLDTPVINYLPEFKLKSGSYHLITCRHLLSNSSGMPDDFKPQYEAAWQNPEYDKDALKRRVLSFQDRKMLFKPGRKWAYSNLGFELLGYLIERVSGQPFEQYMRQNIFVPLHMTSTTFFYKEVPDTLLAWPHIKDQKGAIVPSLFYPYNRSRIPSSDLNTSMQEMKNFAEFVFNRGKFRGKEILSEKSFNLMWTKQIETNHRSFPDEHRYNGLGWFMGEHHTLKLIGHIGGDTGSRSSMTYIPEKEIMLFLAGNSDQFTFWELTQNIIDKLVEE